ncbi:T9SS sorting signal type C domain-containing protein [Flavobacterium johnsoniae]|uniref:T9SS sorting signal type C domain-containing protein n=1 Tax=Flavobacterium johnsoniae TaxID=986 RepID=UPI0025B12D2A|nr:T9SS sorting signal type C domain-containing protein [Flavobacterium johnsoniae]WJS95577.1 T9SS sorting signal type C domain-containing protein [Flavobacterium johnsoniae]
MMRKLLYSFLFFIFLHTASFGQSIWSNAITTNNPNLSNPYTTNDVKHANITVSGIGRGDGINGVNANGVYTANNWTQSNLANSMNANDYFEFTLTPNSSSVINLTSFQYVGVAGGGSNPVDNFAVRSSIDNYGSTLGTGASGTITLGTAFQNIGGPVTFRIYAWGASNNGRTYGIDSFQFNGTVTCATNLIKNGNFNNGSTDWSAATAGGTAYTEVLTEGLYFSNGSPNNTAELDSEASLRQPVTVIPGVSYNLSFIYARRPGSQATVGVTARILGGAATPSVSYTTSNTTNTAFTGALTFTPTTSVIYVELYNTLSTTTLGSIVDNIVLIPSSQVAPIATTVPKGSFTTLGSVCAGTPVQLDVDNVPATGVTYSWSSTSPGATFSSTTIKNPTVTFASTLTGIQEVTVVATSANGCAGTPSSTYVNLIAAPTVYTVTGGGAYCSGGTGVAVGLNNSTSGVSYQLKFNGADSGSPVAGTGAAISFGNRTAAGTYTVVATNTNNCALNMSGNAVITIDPTSVGGSIAGSATYCSATNSTTLTLSGHTGSVTRWQSSPSSTFASSVTNISNTTTSLLVTNLATTTYYRAIVTSGTCTSANSATATITVNPVHTITAGADRIVCQNSAMTAITMTLGGGATGATVTNLPPGVTFSVTGNVLTISGTPTVIDVYTYSVTTTGNSCTVATTGGTIRVGIGNNVLTYNNGTSGSVCAGANENNLVSFTAPAGTYFNTVTFASYGLPSGGCGTYAIGSTCHSATSQSVTETNILGRSNTVTFTANNATFGDPCPGTGKYYRGSASYSQPVCEGSDAGTITGSAPTGPGGYTYQWERSTTGASGSFTAITSSNVQSYSPGILTQSTYFRRIVTSNGCTSTSPVVFIRVNPRPTSNVTGSTTICNGQSATVSVTLTGTGPWSLTRSNGSTSTNITNITASPYTFSVSPTSNTNYTVTALSDANCSANAADMTGTATITVNQIEATPSIVSFTDIDCVNATGTIRLGNLPSGAWTINQTGQATATLTGSGTPYDVTGLAAGNYTFTVQTATTCVSVATAPQAINDNSTSTWDGVSWVGGAPTSTKRIVIAANGGTPFPAGTPVVNGCSLTVNPGVNVIVASGVTLVITNAVTTNGQLTFRSGSSLMQTTNVANSGDINYERTTSVRRYDATYWSMPVTNSAFTMATLSPLTLLDKYYWYDPNSTWTISLNGTMPMEVGKGYNIRAPQPFDADTPAPFTGVFVGVPNNGNIAPTVVQDRYNLVGNPYPSAISAAALINGNTNLGTLYFWTHNSSPVLNPADGKYYYNNADFAAFNLTGGTDTSSGANLNGQPFQGYIAAGQGFLAKPKTGTLNFTNSMRRTANNSQFYKIDGSEDSGEIERNRLWLNFSNDLGAFKQILVGYIEGATNSFDINFDATTLGSNISADFYSINESNNMTIQGRALPFDNRDIVPMGYKVATAGEYTIAIDHADGFFDTQEVYLEDLLTAKIVNLRTENYKFTTAIGTFTNRFNLRYTSKTLGTGEFEDLENSVVVSLKNKVVKISSSKEAIKTVNIYNIGAQLLYNKDNVNSSELLISNLNSADQVLLVKITLENGHTVTKKVVYSNL